MTERPGDAVEATSSLAENVMAQHAYLGLARRLRKLPVPVVGLWPVSSKSDFLDVPERLGGSLASLGCQVGILSPKEWREESSRSRPNVTPLAEGIDAIWPMNVLSNISATLEHTLEPVRGRYDCLLLNLAGLDIVELKEVAHIPGVGVVFFLVPGEIDEFAFAKLQQQVPPDRLLGAVFLDAELNAGD